MNYSLYLYPDEKWTPMALRNNEYSEKYVSFLPEIENLYISGDKISLKLEALVKGKKNGFVWKQIEKYPFIPLEVKRK